MSNWFTELMKTPVLVIHRQPKVPQTINNYYIYMNNKIIQVNEEQFRKIAHDKKIITKYD